jgi:hypothetical protein
MADIFDLAPEGQAWTDNLSEDKAARPEDYDPTFFSGSLSAFPRGAAEGTIGLGQTALTFANQLVDSQIAAYSPAPNINLLKLAYPGADQAMNDAYDSTTKSLESARQYVKPDATTQGTAAQILNGLGQFVPAMGATVVGGPVAGGAVAFGSSFEPTRQDFLKKGVNPETATTLATEQAAFNALGMALPAAAGGRLATRLLSGVGINTSFGGLNRFAMGETLDENGYSDMAKQYRVWDGQAIMVDAVLGASFGGLHHWTATRNAMPEAAPEGQTAPAPIPDDGTTVQPEPVQATPTENITPIAESAQAEVAPIDASNSPEATLETPREIPEATPFKPSDVDAAHVLNEGLHYDIESAPVIHASNESVNAHVSAMDAATRSLMNGEPVNISQQIRGLDGLVRPETEVSGLAMRDAMEADIREAGLSATPPRADADIPPAVLREGSAFSSGREDSGAVSTDPDTGEVISGNSFDLLTARDLAADAETKILHPDTGQEVTLSQALADLDEQIATAQKESNVYSVAAACFLRNP